ncbi:MAG: hypothetical protein L0Y71_06765 [Gemmataceae bacterium]|nr:hypothetical protein [Gemmataceae bacterium]
MAAIALAAAACAAWAVRARGAAYFADADVASLAKVLRVVATTNGREEKAAHQRAHRISCPHHGDVSLFNRGRRAVSCRGSLGDFLESSGYVLVIDRMDWLIEQKISQNAGRNDCA